MGSNRGGMFLISYWHWLVTHFCILSEEFYQPSNYRTSDVDDDTSSKGSTSRDEQKSSAGDLPPGFRV